MSSEFRTPYTPTPGGSLPPPHTNPAEGKKELWTFFWLALANTTIIGVAGVATWMLIPH
ncbi:MAG TPA: hypothetical protein VGV89_06270 [Thermoplasmata archaeon]|nr:hypothetical protein [Thermoplasmata archaeon]